MLAFLLVQEEKPTYSPTCQCFPDMTWPNMNVWIKMQFLTTVPVIMVNLIIETFGLAQKWHTDHNMCRDMSSNQSNAALCWSEVLEHVCSKRSKS